jgi:toxin ParE1/3/4
MGQHRPPVVWSPEARADLTEIWNYHARVAGAYSADKIIRGIAAACQPLEQHPFAGRSRDELRPGMRSVAASPHAIFYRLVEGRAEIVRVIDGRRDIEDVFTGG